MKAWIVLTFLSAAVYAQQPSIVPGGVLNAASFAKNADGTGAPVAPGSLVAIFGSGLGASQADADSVPFSTSLGGVTVMFNNVQAPMRDVIPAAGIVNVEVPFAAMQAGQGSATVNVTVTFNNQSASTNVTLVPAAPGVFTLPSGAGAAILVNLTDGTIAAPAPNVPGFSSLASHPIPRGTQAFFYATGLGAMTPPVNDGDGGSSCPPSGCVVNVNPIVWIGGVNTGVMVPVEFAGQAPGFPGVYQVNIQIPSNAPTGDNIDLQLTSVDGRQVSPAAAKISIQ